MRDRLHQLIVWRRLRRKPDNATRVLPVFFLLVILAGTVLLALPVSSVSGDSCGPVTALFTATSAACVTGLSTVVTAEQWSLFGKVVLLLLIQVGGLGYMTFVSVGCLLLRRRVGLRERLILQQAMALNELDGIIRLVRLVVEGTFLMEGVGAVILAVRFAGQFPVPRAIWYGVFHAVSAYCNAGFDLLGSTSMTAYAGDPVVSLTLIVLTVVGGLGFFVWNDLLRHRFRWKRLAVHTKLVLVITAALLLGGMLAFLAMEWNNAATIGNMPLWEKSLASLFQSATCRTAGFATVQQGDLTGSSKLVSILLMLVGGSSGSTAGGIKTVSVGLLILTAWRVLRGHRDVVVFGRKIPQDQINSAGCLCILVVALSLTGGIIISTAGGIPLGDALYESVSAICTVGLSTGITAGLGVGAKLLLVVYMFFGRVGIITISLAFMYRTPPDKVVGRPETRVLVG